MRVRIGSVTYSSDEYPICIEFNEDEAWCLNRRDWEKDCQNQGGKVRFSVAPKHFFPNRTYHEQWMELMDYE